MAIAMTVHEGRLGDVEEQEHQNQGSGIGGGILEGADLMD
jgi:hypothetical protein